MISRIQASVIVVIVVIVFAAGIVTTGGTVQAAWLRFFPGAITVVMIAVAFWEYWLWRQPWIQRIPIVARDIRGTWKGELETFWKDSTGTSPSRKTVFLVVRQSASQVSVVLLTNEQRSASTLAQVFDDGAAVTLDYTYATDPDVHVALQNPKHHGSASLVVSGKPAERLRGHYWTNRGTRGELDLTARLPSVFAEDLDQAARAFA